MYDNRYERSQDVRRFFFYYYGQHSRVRRVCKCTYIYICEMAIINFPETKTRTSRAHIKFSIIIQIITIITPVISFVDSRTLRLTHVVTKEEGAAPVRTVYTTCIVYGYELLINNNIHRAGISPCSRHHKGIARTLLSYQQRVLSTSFLKKKKQKTGT